MKQFGAQVTNLRQRSARKEDQILTNILRVGYSQPALAFMNRPGKCNGGVKKEIWKEE